MKLRQIIQSASQSTCYRIKNKNNNINNINNINNNNNDNRRCRKALTIIVSRHNYNNNNNNNNSFYSAWTEIDPNRLQKPKLTEEAMEYNSWLEEKVIRILLVVNHSFIYY